MFKCADYNTVDFYFIAKFCGTVYQNEYKLCICSLYGFGVIQSCRTAA